MWIKGGVLGDSGPRNIFSNLAVWIMAGVGITIAFQSSRKWVDYCSKKKVDVSQKENCENDSGIDGLPDDILSDIVSRLKPIEASRTSILSRRWRKFWTNNQNLEFYCLNTLDIFERHHDDVSYCDRQRFLKAVNQRLQLYSDTKLKVFFLHCCFLNDHTCHLARWMQTLATLDVADLYLGNSCNTCNGDPLDRAFTFSFKLIDGLSKLKYLDLTSCNVDTGFAGPCNSLVMLNLSHIPLLSHTLTDILMYCPNLGSLCMEHCELPLNLRISGPNHKLVILKLLVCYNVQKLEISDLNVLTIKIDIHSEVEIILSSVPKLGRLDIRTPGVNNCFGDVSRDLPQLKCLLVQTSYQILQLPPTLQVFRSVRVLCFITRGYPCPEAYGEVDLWNFASVLVVCQLLEEFYMVISCPVCKEERNAEWPVLRHKNLTVMDLSGFSEMQNELEFAKFILTSAQVLKSFKLWSSKRNFDGENLYIDDEKDLKQRDAQQAQVLCANLQKHALSTRAIVQFF